MKKRMTKLMSMGAVGMLSAGMVAAPAMAADQDFAGANLTEDGAGTTYTEASAQAVGNSIQFVKTLTMDSEAHVPNVKFYYTLSTPQSHVRDENTSGASRAGANNNDNYPDDNTTSTKEYTSARVAVKENGVVKYTELYSGGDTTKVTGQPLFKENRTSPAKSSYEDKVDNVKVKNTSGGNTGATIEGGKTGVVTFFSGADAAYYEGAATVSTEDDVQTSKLTKSGTQTGEEVYDQTKETPTKTTVQETTATGDNMKVNGGKGGQSQTADDSTMDKSKDYINGAGLNKQELNNENSNANPTNQAIKSGKKYAYANVELDFSSVSFNEPGIYRWYITESDSINTADTKNAEGKIEHWGITDDEDNTRILDVYVTDNGEGKLQISGYVMHNEKDTELETDSSLARGAQGSKVLENNNNKVVTTTKEGDTGRGGDGKSGNQNKAYDYSFENNEFKSNVPNAAGTDLDKLNQTKPDGFANDYETENLRLKKVVTGNQGSRDEYFRFEVTIKNGLPGCVYDVNYAPTGVNQGLIGGTIIDGTASNSNNHYYFATQSDAKNRNSNNTLEVPINGADEGKDANGTAVGTDTTGVNNQGRTAGTTGITHTNPTRLVADVNGNVTAVIWLQHNQEIQISGLPKNSEYSIKEDGAEMDREGYITSSAFNKEWTTKDGGKQTWACDTDGVTQMEVKNGTPTYEIKDTAMTADTGYVVTNHKSGIIPTAVLMTVIPGAAAVILGGTGVTALKMRKNRDEDDDI